MTTRKPQRPAGRKYPRKRRGKKTSRTLRRLASAIIIAAIILMAGIITDAFTSGDFTTNTTDGQDVATQPARQLLEVGTPDSIDEDFIEYSGFYVSFNPHYHIPNYVAYELTRTEAEGDESRARSFRQDETVEGCPEPSDYTRSGYDRGHMAPAADMKWSSEAMHESFYMTNICPQKHALNGGGWKRLEEKVRDWAIRDSALIVITGPILSPDMPTIGHGVAVPGRFFKAILAPYAHPMRGIAFIYKNEGGQKTISRQAVSIDSVEKVTGLDLFQALPDDEEKRIEKSTNYNLWNKN